MIKIKSIGGKVISKAINILSHSNHFFYTNNLIKSLQRNALDIANFPIFIFLDNNEELNSFFKSDKELCKDLILVDIEKFISGMHQKEGVQNLQQRNRPDKYLGTWGAGGHRTWVALKRSYSFLYLKQMGYNFAWALDAESLVLKIINIEDLFKKNLYPPRLIVAENEKSEGYIRFNNKILDYFTQDLNKELTVTLKTAGIRQNDFWIIDLHLFQNAISYIEKEISEFFFKWMGGSEQWIYETYLYRQFLLNPKSINLVSFKDVLVNQYPEIDTCDLHGNRLFKNILNLKKIDLLDFAHIMNVMYFNFTQSYRGDYLLELKKTRRGRTLLKNLNINVAVSNFQGF